MPSMRWTKHLSTKEGKDEFTKKVMAAREVLDILRDILQEDVDALEKEIESKDTYFMPAWSEYQADRIGSKRVLRKVINLISE